MKRWFDRLPIHRKLVVMALGVTATALLVAMLGLVIVDAFRFRSAALDDITSLAQVLAENTAAAIAFDEPEAARDTLSSVRVRAAVLRACLYQPDGTLFAGFARPLAEPCPPHELPAASWAMVTGTAPVVRNDRLLGLILVERDLSNLSMRLAMTVGVCTAILVMAGFIAYGLAHRVHRTVSAPISALAAAARTIGSEQGYEVPRVAAPPDEIGELAHAFDGMVERVRDATSSLVQTNEALRREIEERRRIEAEREQLLVREREANRLKDEFLAAISHELRTPLNAIVGWTHVLASGSPDHETLDRAIRSLIRNTDAQTRVIDDLIDVSRIVTGKLYLRLEPVDLRTIVDAAIDVIEPAARAKEVRVDVDQPDTPCLVNGDRDRLQQVVWNLLSNALKFTERDGRVTVSLREHPSGFALVVTDSGIGIAPDFLSFVFDRFRQADGSITRQHGGLGLGLAIVKELTELHGGTVTVASGGVGQGATFTVELPRLAPRDAAAASAAPDAALPLPSLAGIRVLAVDDSPDALDILATTLERAGAEVAVASSGAAALALWQRTPCDVLLCDLGMPQMDGFQVLKRIRDLDAAVGRVTPAIAITAHASEDFVARSIRAGFQRHLAKPFRGVEVVRAVASAFQQV